MDKLDNETPFITNLPGLLQSEAPAPQGLERVFLAAADYLIVHGWEQGDFGDDGGPRCLVGAFRSVTKKESVIDEATDFLQQNYLWEKTKELTVIAWNDDGHRTFDEVLAALYECAEMAGGK